MTWVILGANGQLGKELYFLLKSSNIDVIGLTKEEIDLSKPELIEKKLSKYPAKYIVNCAAYTQVDKAEEEIDLANKINGQSEGKIAKYALENYIPFVHISTDYVFEGNSKSPYVETDKPNPQSVYGKSKLLGETVKDLIMWMSQDDHTDPARLLVPFFGSLFSETPRKEFPSLPPHSPVIP